METSKTLAEVLAWEGARVGLSGLPREWTPGNWDNSDNDCAVFQSMAFFGDIQYYVVSQFYNDGKRNSQVGSAAKPGALACFQWPGSADNFDHIGLVTSYADANGNFQTIEANTSGSVSGHQVARKTRPTAYVVGFVYPTYAADTTTASTGGSIPLYKKDIKVNFWRDTAGTIYYGAYAIPNQTTYAVLQRYDASTLAKPATLNPVEAGWVKKALKANGLG